jgi:hypothetical protein
MIGHRFALVGLVLSLVGVVLFALQGDTGWVLASASVGLGCGLVLWRWATWPRRLGR